MDFLNTDAQSDRIVVITIFLISFLMSSLVIRPSVMRVYDRNTSHFKEYCVHTVLEDKIPSDQRFWQIYQMIRVIMGVVVPAILYTTSMVIFIRYVAKRKMICGFPFRINNSNSGPTERDNVDTVQSLKYFYIIVHRSLKYATHITVGIVVEIVPIYFHYYIMRNQACALIQLTLRMTSILMYMSVSVNILFNKQGRKILKKIFTKSKVV
ncbi:hypothetical protein ACOME3_002221 [Neoechinorhynchus agilis]